MIEFSPYIRREKYKHMGERDAAIWERFILLNPSAFDAVAYDIPVGEGAAFDTVVSPDTGGDQARLYKKKIDVVASRGDVLFIVEVKPEAGLGAIGQVVSYGSLFKREYEPTQALQLAIITDHVKPDMEFLAKEQRVALFVA